MINPEILGKYYTEITDNPNPAFYNKFILEIYFEKNIPKFSFEMITETSEGTIGITWIGKLIDRIDNFNMVVEKEIDWVKLKKEDNRTENAKDKNEVLKVSIYPEEEKIIIFNPLFTKYLTLYKID